MSIESEKMLYSDAIHNDEITAYTFMPNSPERAVSHSFL